MNTAPRKHPTLYNNVNNTKNRLYSEGRAATGRSQVLLFPYTLTQKSFLNELITTIPPVTP